MVRFEDWNHCRRMAIMTKTVVKEQVCYLYARPSYPYHGHDSAVLIDFCRQHLHQRFVCLSLRKLRDTLSQRSYVTVTDTVAGLLTAPVPVCNRQTKYKRCRNCRRCKCWSICICSSSVILVFRMFAPMNMIL